VSFQQGCENEIIPGKPIGHITLQVKLIRKSGPGNPGAGSYVAGAGNEQIYCNCAPVLNPLNCKIILWAQA